LQGTADATRLLIDNIHLTEPMFACNFHPHFSSIITSFTRDSKNIRVFSLSATSSQRVQTLIKQNRVLVAVVPPHESGVEAFLTKLAHPSKVVTPTMAMDHEKLWVSISKSEGLFDTENFMTLSKMINKSKKYVKSLGLPPLPDPADDDEDSDEQSFHSTDTDSDDDDENYYNYRIKDTDCDCESCVSRDLKFLVSEQQRVKRCNGTVERHVKLENAIQRVLSSRRVRKNSLELQDEIVDVKASLCALQTARIFHQRQCSADEEQRKKDIKAKQKAEAAARRVAAETERKAAELARLQERERVRAMQQERERVQEMIASVAKGAVNSVLASARRAEEEERLAVFKAEQEKLKRLRALNAAISTKEREVVATTERRKKEVLEEERIARKELEKSKKAIEATEAVKTKKNTTKKTVSVPQKTTRTTAEGQEGKKGGQPVKAAMKIVLVRAVQKPLAQPTPEEDAVSESGSSHATSPDSDQTQKRLDKAQKKEARRVLCAAAGLKLTTYARGFLARNKAKQVKKGLALLKIQAFGRVVVAKALRKRAATKKLEDDTKMAIRLSLLETEVCPPISPAAALTADASTASGLEPATLASSSGWKAWCRNGASCRFNKYGKCKFYHEEEDARVDKDATRVKTKTTNAAPREGVRECPICLDELLEPHALNCGHVLCGKCITKATDKCFTCGTQIEYKMKIFF